MLYCGLPHLAVKNILMTERYYYATWIDGFEGSRSFGKPDQMLGERCFAMLENDNAHFQMQVADGSHRIALGCVKCFERCGRI